MDVGAGEQRVRLGALWHKANGVLVWVGSSRLTVGDKALRCAPVPWGKALTAALASTR